MSERGSFVTEYIYCELCLIVAREVLLDHRKFLCSTVVPSWEYLAPGMRDELPIVAGKIGGLSPGEEFHDMEFYYGEQLNAGLCHPLRVAVLADNGEGRFFTFGPEDETS